MTFPGINPHCCAWTCDRLDDLKAKWDKIPEETDILVTHGPPYGYLDTIGDYGAHVGDIALSKFVERIKPRLHVFSHIHEHGGKVIKNNGTIYVNCSIMDEFYTPTNKPVRIEWNGQQ